jgi:Recombination endonuclease VII
MSFDQVPMFDMAIPERQLSESPRSRPVCIRCRKPATMLQDGSYGQFCRAQMCVSRDRYCAYCQSHYETGTTGRRRLYCSDECMFRAQGVRKGSWVCECGYVSFSKSQGLDGHCFKCWQKQFGRRSARLRAHNVGWDRAISWQESDWACEVCGCATDVDPRAKHKGAIDHDHDCCPGSESCGTCVRGYLCGRCNSAIGLMGDSAEHVRAALRYLGG